MEWVFLLVHYTPCQDETHRIFAGRNEQKGIIETAGEDSKGRSGISRDGMGSAVSVEEGRMQDNVRPALNLHGCRSATPANKTRYSEISDGEIFRCAVALAAYTPAI
jgi:hypothetical protein